MVGVQAAVCVGAVYLKSALAHVAPGSFYPAVFAFFREAAAGVLLCGAATATTGVAKPRRADMPALLGAGLCLFASQALYVHGIDAAGVAVAASLQPAVPIWTAALGVATRAERPTRQKLAGIGLAAAGALCMVSGPAHAAGPVAARAAASGKAALAAGTVAMALFYRTTARLVRVYPPLCVAGWAYVPAAAAMGLAALASAPASAWTLAPPLRGPLLFWVAACSCYGYGATAAAARVLPASHVAAFTCLQPFLGTAGAALFLGEAVTPRDAGALGVLAGLALVARDAASGGGAAGPRPGTALAAPPGWKRGAE